MHRHDMARTPLAVVGAAAAAGTALYKGKPLVEPETKEYSMALDVVFAKMEEGNDADMLQRLGSEPTKEEGNKARAFEINDDGTVSPKEATGLVLGMAFVPPQLPRGYSCLDAV